MPKRLFFIIGISFACIVGGLLLSRVVSAAELFMYPKEQQVIPGQEFSVDVRCDAKLDKINVVKTTIAYPADLLEPVGVSTRGSFLPLWADGPTIDTNSATIHMTGGIPLGSYSIGGRVATVTFKAKTQGKAIVTINASSSEVLLNDGKGTPTSLTVTEGTYYVIDQVANAIAISSPTHPNENAWYPGRAVRMVWGVRPNAEYSYVISKNPLETPDVIPDQATGEASFQNLVDGAWYFILQERITGGDWQVVGRRKALVDGTAPAAIQWNIGRDEKAYEGKWFLAFSSTDSASGIMRFDVTENGVVHANVISPYILDDQNQQSSLSITAYDAAGNSTNATVRTSHAAGKQFSNVVAGIVFAVACIGGIVLIWIRRRRKRKTIE